MDPFQLKFHDFHEFNIKKLHIWTSNFRANGCSTLRKAEDLMLFPAPIFGYPPCPHFWYVWQTFCEAVVFQRLLLRVHSIVLLHMFSIVCVKMFSRRVHGGGGRCVAQARCHSLLHSQRTAAWIPVPWCRQELAGATWASAVCRSFDFSREPVVVWF